MQTSISISALWVIALIRSSIHASMLRSSWTSQSLQFIRRLASLEHVKSTVIPHVGGYLFISRSSEWSLSAAFDQTGRIDGPHTQYAAFLQPPFQLSQTIVSHSQYVCPAARQRLCQLQGHIFIDLIDSRYSVKFPLCPLLLYRSKASNDLLQLISR